MSDKKGKVNFTEPEIGERVICSMDGVDFFRGVYVEESDILVKYGVQVDGSTETSFFRDASPVKNFVDSGLGMYGETHRVTIGEFSICRFDPSGKNDSVWIEREGAEGFQLSDEILKTEFESLFNKYL